MNSTYHHALKNLNQMYKLFICVKGHSSRCPNKNANLIRFTIDWIRDTGHANDTVVISDSNFICCIAEYHHIKYYHEPNNFDNELMSIHRYLKQSGEHIDDVIVVPVTQPVRNKELLDELINEPYGDADFITTKRTVSDRHIFYVDDNNNFIYNSEQGERKGSLCKQQWMLDGSLYKLKVSVLGELAQSINPNKCLWTDHKFKTIVNSSYLYFDIDEPHEYAEFMRYKTRQEQAILIANKPVVSYPVNISCYDKVARVSRCTNHSLTGDYADILFIEASSVFFYYEYEWVSYLYNILKNVRTVVLPFWRENMIDTCKERGLISDSNQSLIVINKQMNCEFHECVPGNPTSSILMLYWLLQQGYHVTISAMDFINRQQNMPQEEFHFSTYIKEEEWLFKLFIEKKISLGDDIEI